MTLGSLFDGIGGWQLAAARWNIENVWSSEIDKFCCKVTKEHFPNTIQLGDVTRLDDVPPVDIICAGSPCQGLSLMGHMHGLKDERSGLLYEAFRIVKKAKPKIFIWENVPGAFASNKGADFKVVLENFIGQRVPMPASGRWKTCGVAGEPGRISIEWRVLDTRYFGVSQRRRRIFLVVDFTGRSFGKILFADESSPIRLDKSGAEGQTVAGGVPEDSYCILGNTIGRTIMNGANGTGISEGVAYTLDTKGRHAVAYGNTVRYFTPVECERLQGLPDGWTEGGTDAQRYKALGNGMAQPCADWVIARVRGFLNREENMT